MDSPGSRKYMKYFIIHIVLFPSVFFSFSLGSNQNKKPRLDSVENLQADFPKAGELGQESQLDLTDYSPVSNTTEKPPSSSCHGAFMSSTLNVADSLDLEESARVVSSVWDDNRGTMHFFLPQMPSTPPRQERASSNSSAYTPDTCASNNSAAPSMTSSVNSEMGRLMAGTRAPALNIDGLEIGGSTESFVFTEVGSDEMQSHLDLFQDSSSSDEFPYDSDFSDDA